MQYIDLLALSDIILLQFIAHNNLIVLLYNLIRTSLTCVWACTMKEDLHIILNKVFVVCIQCSVILNYTAGDVTRYKLIAFVPCTTTEL